MYIAQKIKIKLINIIRADDKDIIKKVTFNPDTLLNNMPTKLRTGRPRDNWLKETMQEYWNTILKEHTRDKRTDTSLHGIPKKRPIESKWQRTLLLNQSRCQRQCFRRPTSYRNV